MRHVRRITVTLPVLAACGGGPNEETLFTHLQVAAVIAEPPEIGPGDTSTFTAHVLDPEGVGPDTWMWTCTPGAAGCAEAALPGGGVQRGNFADGTFSGGYFAPAELAAYLSDPTVMVPVIVWSLACRPGACPEVEAAEAAPDPTSEEGLALTAALADPTAWMAEKDIADASLTLQTLWLSARPVEERVQNPVFTLAPEAEQVGAPEEERILPFTVEPAEGVTLWGYATVGGFTQPSWTPDEGGFAELGLVLPVEPSEGELIVVAVGEQGGQAAWRGQVRAE